MDNKRALIISPHPDDLEIGMGGTAAKMAEGGIDIASLVVTDGRRSTSEEGLSEEKLAEIRKNEVREAAGILGLDMLIHLELPDAKGDNIPVLKEEIENVLQKLKPGEIYLPHPEIDKHPTHKAVSNAVLEKLRELSGEGQKAPERIWCYEVWTPFPSYDRIEDITEYVEVKSALINAHKSQLYYKNYTEGMLGLNRYRAVFNERHGMTEETYAEVFIELKL